MKNMNQKLFVIKFTNNKMFLVKRLKKYTLVNVIHIFAMSKIAINIKL